MLKKSIAAVLTASLALSAAGCDAFGARKNMGAVDQGSGTDYTEPTDETMVPSGTSFPDSYQRAVSAYLKLLEDNKDAITGVEDAFKVNPVGIYDIDGNGIPELYFLASTDEDQLVTSDLFVYTYNEFAGEAVKIAEVKSIIYMGASGGLFQMYATSDRLIIVHAGGEDADFNYRTEIYSFNGDLIDSYRRNYLYDYDAPEDQATTIKYYRKDAEISEEEYNKVLKPDVENTVIVLASNYTPAPDDVEYPLLSKPSFAMLEYGTAYKYIKSLQS